MTALTEGHHPGDCILSEQPGTLSRNTVTVEVPAATTLGPNTVLGTIAGSGHLAPYDDANSDGTETASAVLVGELDNSEGVAMAEMEGVVVDFGAEVRKDALVWGAGVDEDGGIADLLTAFIKARD